MISAAAFGAVNAGLGLATSTIDIIRGQRMAKQAKEDLKNLKRPMMQVPQAQRQQVELYRQAMTGGMPGQQAIGDTIGQSMPYLAAGGDNGVAGSSWERFRAMYGTPMTS